MQGFLFYIFVGLIGLIIQGSILKVILPFGAIPNLILILVVYLGFFRQKNDAALFAFFLGLEYDLFGSHLLLGPNASAAVLVYFLVTSFSKRLFVDSPFTLGLVVLVASFVSHGVAAIITSQFVPTEGLLTVIFRYSPLEAFASALVAPFVFKYLKRINVEGRTSKSSMGDPGWSS
ncbi:MAG: rod shape-determining protein MreD [bacterium]|nr:rod shape-determining protein MreD [bacterium]